MNACPSPHSRTEVLSQGKSNKTCSFFGPWLVEGETLLQKHCCDKRSDHSLLSLHAYPLLRNCLPISNPKQRLENAHKL